jgi:hypothetical protein
MVSVTVSGLLLIGETLAVGYHQGLAQVIVKCDFLLKLGTIAPSTLSFPCFSHERFKNGKPITLGLQVEKAC